MSNQSAAAESFFAAMSEVKRQFLEALSLRHVRRLVVLGLWLAFMIWNVVGIFAAFGTRPPNFNNLNGPVFQLALNAWGLVAGLIFGLIIANPFGWLNGKRLVVGCMAFAAMLGRLVSGTTIGLLVTMAPPSESLLFFATPFLLLLAGFTVIIAIFFVVGLLYGLFIAIPVMLFSQLLAFDNAITIYRHQARGLASYIVRAVYWLRNEPMPASKPDDSKGARLATISEIQKIHAPNAPEAMSFGHIGSALFLKTDKHVLIMASTRSGKGVTLIIPHLLRYRGSAFVLDPKGENARATGRTRATLNDKVHYLDPFGISGKPQSRFNPLARFTPDNMEAESKALAAALFVVGERERDHWTAAGQQLLAAVILYVYLSPKIAPANKDLPAVRKILLGGLKDALADMMNITAADGLLSDLSTSFRETPEREFGSIVSTAQRQTEILDNPFMIACLSASGTGPEVDFAAWHRGTMTVYLCLSAPKFPTFNRWLRLLLTSALDEMTDRLDPPTLPVCFMLDELATLGHLQTVENAVGLAAGYGIQLVTVFQDVAQMRDLYKGRWASFIGNAGVRALFNLDDYDTAKYWSDFIGGTLVPTATRQEDLYGLSSGQNVGEAMRPLLPTDKIMMDFASGKMLVLAQGAHPIITNRLPYWDNPNLKGLWDDPRAPLPRLQPPRAAPPAAPTTPTPRPPQAPLPGLGGPLPPRARAEPAPAARSSAPASPPLAGGTFGLSGLPLTVNSVNDRPTGSNAPPRQETGAAKSETVGARRTLVERLQAPTGNAKNPTREDDALDELARRVAKGVSTEQTPTRSPIDMDEFERRIARTHDDDNLKGLRRDGPEFRVVSRRDDDDRGR